jgi:hypothetical protein
MQRTAIALMPQLFSRSSCSAWCKARLLPKAASMQPMA